MQKKSKILAIGGAVIKTALPELKFYIENDNVEMLIHNGGSLFHDIQCATDPVLQERGITSYPLEELVENPSINYEASLKTIESLFNILAPEGSVTRMCQNKNIPVLVFTAPGCDFWHLHLEDWGAIGRRCQRDFVKLVNRMRLPFHYLLMGSAVIHPEVFIKAVSQITHISFQADVVDFAHAYRPSTRVAKYGKYYRMHHKDFLRVQ